MDVEHDSQARLRTQVLSVCPRQPPNAYDDGNRDIQTVIDGKETCPLNIRASRVKKVVANSAQRHRIHSYMRISTGRPRKSIASVKRNVDLGQYVVKLRLLLAAATRKEQPDDNPKTRNTLLLRFHDPQTEV